MKPEDFMRRAIELSRQKIALGERPFGAVVVRNDEIIGEGTAQQVTTKDPTAHAETIAIRAATRARDSLDLGDCDLYTSCEPCPMCTAVIWNTGIRKVYYANVRADFVALGRPADDLARQIALPLAERSRPHVRLLAAEAKNVLDEWRRHPQFSAAMRRRS